MIDALKITKKTLKKVKLQYNSIKMIILSLLLVLGSQFKIVFGAAHCNLYYYSYINYTYIAYSQTYCPGPTQNCCSYPAYPSANFEACCYNSSIFLSFTSPSKKTSPSNLWWLNTLSVIVAIVIVAIAFIVIGIIFKFKNKLFPNCNETTSSEPPAISTTPPPAPPNYISTDQLSILLRIKSPTERSNAADLVDQKMADKNIKISSMVNEDTDTWEESDVDSFNSSEVSKPKRQTTDLRVKTGKKKQMETGPI